MQFALRLLDVCIKVYLIVIGKDVLVRATCLERRCLIVISFVNFLLFLLRRTFSVFVLFDAVVVYF
jgi:hypothetical protein